jgi:hypothetical protein
VLRVLLGRDHILGTFIPVTSEELQRRCSTFMALAKCGMLQFRSQVVPSEPVSERLNSIVADFDPGAKRADLVDRVFQYSMRRHCGARSSPRRKPQIVTPAKAGAGVQSSRVLDSGFVRV